MGMLLAVMVAMLAAGCVTTPVAPTATPTPPRIQIPLGVDPLMEFCVEQPTTYAPLSCMTVEELRKWFLNLTRSD